MQELMSAAELLEVTTSHHTSNARTSNDAAYGAEIRQISFGVQQLNQQIAETKQQLNQQIDEMKQQLNQQVAETKQECREANGNIKLLSNELKQVWSRIAQLERIESRISTTPTSSEYIQDENASGSVWRNHERLRQSNASKIVVPSVVNNENVMSKMTAPMCHYCIPSRQRKLLPNGAPIHNGIIVPCPFPGIKFVFRDKDSPLFILGPNHKNGAENAQNHQHIETSLYFGDTIIFTADEQQYTVIDYEKELYGFETDSNSVNFLLKTICILPPVHIDPLRCWCHHFGWIQLSQAESDQLHMRAMPDVPIYSWVSIQVLGDRVVPKFQEFVKIAVDERQLAWDMEWNLNNENRPTNSHKFEKITNYGDDENGQPDEFNELPNNQRLHVKRNMKGCLIGTRELFCNELREYRVFVGFWQKHECNKPDNVPLGQRCNFDAYFNEIHGIYIAYFCEFDEDQQQQDEDLLCDVFLPEFDNAPTLIGITICPSETWGALYKTKLFGLVADPARLLGTLPYMDEVLRNRNKDAADVVVAADDLAKREEEDSEQYTGKILIYIVDSGPSKHKLCRFKLYDEVQPIETVRLVQKANKLSASKKLIADGFIYNSFNKFVYVPNYATQLFIFPVQHIHNFPVGYWFKLKAKFNPKMARHEIIGAEIDEHREIVPHNRIDEQIGVSVSGITTIQRYEFKIDVELCTGMFANDQQLLFINAMYGFILDIGEKFNSTERTKKYNNKVIIGSENCSNNDGTPFKFIRMAVNNEQMMFERKPTNADIPYNTDTIGTDGECNEENQLGIVNAVGVDKRRRMTQKMVECLQKNCIVELKLKAHERDRKKKLLAILRRQEETRATSKTKTTASCSQITGNVAAGHFF
ncbi:hypothetical protein niasHT_020616 [Heterodera trifolii]|uniref:Uncharacterized protein n=1 Tax=Heterodera trifolii TaxID=157864 RepID=A0ABD2KL27_9BILA